MIWPRLHVVTDDDVLEAPAFQAAATAVLEALGADVALHLRGHRTAGRRLHALAAALGPEAERAGAMLLIADRIDVALAIRSAGVRLGRLSIPVAVARRLIGDRPLACSAHEVDEAARAAGDGADLIVLGTVWATPSHPGREGSGPALIRRLAERCEVPIVAIGGVTPARATEAIEAGAHGVAVLSGVWSATDPVAAALEYRERLVAATRSEGGEEA